MPTRFPGMILSWQSALLALGDAGRRRRRRRRPIRRAARRELPPVEALRYEM